MALKLLVVAVFLVQVVVINLGDAQFIRLNPRIEELLKNMSRRGGENCGETHCNPPCPGAMPPLRCPENIPICHFGCACHTNCNNGMMVCFETKHCLEGRRIFTARRRAKIA